VEPVARCPGAAVDFDDGGERAVADRLIEPREQRRIAVAQVFEVARLDLKARLDRDFGHRSSPVFPGGPPGRPGQHAQAAYRIQGRRARNALPTIWRDDPAMLQPTSDPRRHLAIDADVISGDYGLWNGHRIPEDRGAWHPLVRQFYDYWRS